MLQKGGAVNFRRLYNFNFRHFRKLIFGIMSTSGIADIDPKTQGPEVEKLYIR